MQMANGAIYPSLKDRTVFVSGGASGIGEAIVGFVDIADDAAAKLTAELGQGVRFEHCDITDIAALRSAIEAVRAALGPITVLVNNAAHDQRHSIDEVTPEFFDDRIAVNLKHQFFAAQAIYPDMRAANNGSIVNLGSSAWMNATPNLPIYSASKAGVLGLTRALARDLGGYNIRVNSVMPGWTMTQRQIDLWLTPEAEKTLLERQCLKRKLYPDDVARLVLFLASDDASGCTNQNYIIDGGRL
jgi:NAD(P)-dependent dehydrogenase (short-subunit alcohol dehydrogenase family)